MYYFIVNPNSKCGRGLAVWKAIQRDIQKANLQIDYEVYMTTKPGDAREFSRRLTGKCRDKKTITVIGGDGTLNEVVDGTCMNCDNISIEYIPTGATNSLARSLKLQMNLKKQLKQLSKEKADEAVDYGVLNCQDGNRRFVVSAGIGFDAAMCHDFLDDTLRKKMNARFGGFAAYLATVCREISRLKPCKGYIEMDGEKRREFNNILFISAHIQPYEGGSFKLAPDADCRDGMIDLCVVSCKNKFRLFSVLLSALTGTHRHISGVHTYRCRSVKIHTENKLPVHTDGESCGEQTDITLNCVPRKLRLMV